MSMIISTVIVIMWTEVGGKQDNKGGEDATLQCRDEKHICQLKEEK